MKKNNLFSSDLFPFLFGGKGGIVSAGVILFSPDVSARYEQSFLSGPLILELSLATLILLLTIFTKKLKFSSHGFHL